MPRACCIDLGRWRPPNSRFTETSTCEDTAQPAQNSPRIPASDRKKARHPISGRPLGSHVAQRTRAARSDQRIIAVFRRSVLALPYNNRSVCDAIRAVRPRRALPFRKHSSSSDARPVSIGRAFFLLRPELYGRASMAGSAFKIDQSRMSDHPYCHLCRRGFC